MVFSLILEYWPTKLEKNMSYFVNDHFLQMVKIVYVAAQRK